MITMFTKETAFRVDCREHYRPDTVYVRHTTYEGETLADFLGCDFYDQSSDKCEACIRELQRKFNSQHPELQSIHWRRP